MVVFPNAKINLGLNIINKRPDGYHEIQSCFLPIKWFDVLEAIEASTFSFTSSGIPIPGDAATNLCVKAYQLLKKDFNLPEIAIHLHKNIPIGAGLGGGSADCAFMLSLLNEKFDLKISRVRLESYAATLGSDIPFFINNKPTYVEGTGHTFTSINLNLSGLYLLAAYPKIHISTQEAYAQVNPKRPQSELKKVLETLPIEQWQNEVKNDFEQALLKKFPVIDEMKRHFLDIGSIYTSMTGSGSAVFGLFLEKPVVKIDFPHVLFKID